MANITRGIIMNRQSESFKILLAKQGLTNKELADKLNIKVLTISLWVEGIVELTEDDAQLIARTLNISVKDLFE